MKYAQAFWELFGLPITGWDSLSYGDFVWMKDVADQQERALKAQERQMKASQPRR